MMNLENIQHPLYWATHRRVPEQFAHNYLNGTIHAMAWLLLQGSVTIDYPDEPALTYPTGKWLFLKAAGGMQNFTDDAELISIRFDLLHSHGAPLFERPETVVVDESDASELTERAHRMIAILDNFRQGRNRYVPRREISIEANFQLESHFCAWIAEYIRLMRARGQTITSGRINDERVREALLQLNRHNTQQKFVEADVARACGLSVNRLNALFRQELGRTIADYYMLRRLRLAREALLDPNKQIKEIAFELGFRSPANFSNWFTQRQKISPRDFRQKLNPPAS